MRNLSVGQTPPRRGSTAVEIARMLETRIRNGDYRVGDQLPTVRELAQQLSVNKNTVVRAYQNLERNGFLEVTRGRGAFVRAHETRHGSVDARWRARLDQLIDEARRHAVPRDALLAELGDGLDRGYGQNGLRIAFVECNPRDIEALSGEISGAIGYPLEGVLLSEVVSQPADINARFDLVVTTFFHLGEVTRALGAPADKKVVGVHAMPTHDSLLNIARLHVLVIGVVCELPTTVDNLRNIVQTYHTGATVLPALIDDESRLQAILGKADALVATRSCSARLLAMAPRAPVITVGFTVDQQSIDFLRGRIETRRDAVGQRQVKSA